MYTFILIAIAVLVFAIFLNTPAGRRFKKSLDD